MPRSHFAILYSGSLKLNSFAHGYSLGRYWISIHRIRTY